MKDEKSQYEDPKSRFLELSNRGGDWREVRIVSAELTPTRKLLIVHWPLGGLWKFDLMKNELVNAPHWTCPAPKKAWAVWLELVPNRDPTMTLRGLLIAAGLEEM